MYIIEDRNPVFHDHQKGVDLGQYCAERFDGWTCTRAPHPDGTDHEACGLTGLSFATWGVDDTA